MTRLGLPVLTAAAAIMTAMPARAAMHVDRQMFVERTQTDINGRARRVLLSADRAAPGDRLVFVLRWRNAGDRPLSRPSLVDVVPPGTQPDPSDPAMLVSTDGGQNWGRLDQMWLPTPLGGVRRAVPADITHVRWTLDQSVSPGASGRISFRAIAR